MQKNGIDLSEEGYQGTWYVIDEGYHEGEKVYLLESEDYGDEEPAIIVTEIEGTTELHVLLDGVWNGLEELDY